MVKGKKCTINRNPVVYDHLAYQFLFLQPTSHPFVQKRSARSANGSFFAAGAPDVDVCEVAAGASGWDRRGVESPGVMGKEMPAGCCAVFGGVEKPYPLYCPFDEEDPPKRLGCCSNWLNCCCCCCCC